MPCCVELKHMCKIPPPSESPPALTGGVTPPSFVPVKSPKHRSVKGSMQGILHQAGVSVFHCCCLIPGWGRGLQGRTGEAIPGTQEGGNSQNHLGIYGRGRGATIMTEVGVGRPGK